MYKVSYFYLLHTLRYINFSPINLTKIDSEINVFKILEENRLIFDSIKKRNVIYFDLISIFICGAHYFMIKTLEY